MEKREKCVVWSLPMPSIMLFDKDASVDLARTDLASRQIAIDAERFNESQTSPHSAISRHSRLRGGLCVGFSG